MNLWNRAKDYFLHKTYWIRWRFSYTGYMVPRKYKFFTEEEVRGLKPEFVVKLDKARTVANTPFRITSGLRLLSENEQLPNAAKDSAHLSGLAVDLRVQSSTERFRIVKALIAVGFNRIGIYMDGHIHVDDSKTLPQNVMWVVK